MQEKGFLPPLLTLCPSDCCGNPSEKHALSLLPASWGVLGMGGCLASDGPSPPSTVSLSSFDVSDTCPSPRQSPVSTKGPSSPPPLASHKGTLGWRNSFAECGGTGTTFPKTGKAPHFFSPSLHPAHHGAFCIPTCLSLFPILAKLIPWPPPWSHVPKYHQRSPQPQDRTP